MCVFYNFTVYAKQIVYPSLANFTQCCLWCLWHLESLVNMLCIFHRCILPVVWVSHSCVLWVIFVYFQLFFYANNFVSQISILSAHHICRDFVCGDNLSVKITSLYRQCFSPYSGFQLTYTDNSFHLKSWFKKR